jgi:hypothetical protein
MIRPACRGCVVQTRRFGNVHFAADDRLHTGFGRRFVKADGAKQIAVIGDRDGRHAALRGFFSEGFVTARPIEKAVAGMQMKMDEL